MLRNGLLIILLSLFVTSSYANHMFARTVKTEACSKQNLNDLMMVTSDGMWKDGKKMGYYRVMVYLVGWDKPVNIIQFQVMYRNQEKSRMDLMNCAQIEIKGKQTPSIQSVAINEFSNTQTWVRLGVMWGPFSSDERFQLYLFGIDGKLMRHHR